MTKEDYQELCIILAALATIFIVWRCLDLFDGMRDGLVQDVSDVVRMRMSRTDSDMGGPLKTRLEPVPAPAGDRPQ